MKTLLAIAAASLSTMAAAAPLTVYSNNFDGAVTIAPGVSATPTLGTGVTIESRQSLPSMSGNILRGAGLSGGMSEAYTLSLSNLPTHDSLDINFLFAFIDSWDSTNGSPAPDYFYVDIDGVTVGLYTSNNASGSVVVGPGTFLGRTNFGFNGFDDSVWNAATAPELSMAHSASTLTISFYAGGNGWQGGDDESWGIDNLNVVLNTVDAEVPEPAALGFLGLGVAALAARRRRKA